MIQNAWTNLINSVVAATGILEEILLFIETNPAAANTFAILIAFPFILVMFWRIVKNHKENLD